MSTVEQSRKLVTEIPGPKSLEMTKRRLAAVSDPIFAQLAEIGLFQDLLHAAALFSGERAFLTSATGC